MDDMSEQSAPPPAAPTESGQQPGHQSGHQSGPRVSAEQMRDVDRLRRSRTDRYIAGVAGGLGRHFDIDPTIIRVVLAVLTFFGGAGVLVYGAVWLFVPEDGEERAPIEVGTDVRRIILIATGVIALSVVFGTPFFGGGWDRGFPISLLVIGIVVVAVLATRGQRRPAADRNQPPPPWDSAPTPTSSPEGPTMSSTDTRIESGPPPAWMPPQPPAYLPPPRPRRTGLVLFWPTLALIAIALGTLGIFDTSHPVLVSAYAALALGIIGLALLVGAFVGRPGGLIAIGLLASLALLVTGAVDAATDGNATHNKDLRSVPSTSAELSSGYHIPQGTMEIDLTRISDLAALDGRTLDLGLNAGEITVLVPDGLNVHVDADIRYAGEINVGDEQRGGLGVGVEKTLTTSTAPGTPTLELHVEARVGQINVDQRLP
jgi:phage shock protein PspC (stress-responsive transcriptional regulator)